MTPRKRALLLFWTGVVLVLAAVTVPGVPYRHQVGYEADRIEYGDPSVDPPFGSRRVELEDCRGVYEAECLWARRTGGDGSLRVDTGNLTVDPSQVDLFDHTRYFLLESGFTRANATVSGGTIVVRFRPVPPETVFEAAAVEYDAAPMLARRAVESGSATTVYRTWGPDLDRPERVEYVRRNDTVYRLRYTPSGHSPVLPPWIVRLFRVGGFLGGLGLVWVGRGRHVRAGTESDSARR